MFFYRQLFCCCSGSSLGRGKERSSRMSGIGRGSGSPNCSSHPLSFLGSICFFLLFSFVGYCMERFYQGHRGGYYLRNTPFLCGSILKLRKLWKIIAGDQLTSKVGEGRRHIKAWEFMGHGCYRTEVGTLQKRTRKESKIYLMITFHIIFWYLKNRHDLEMEIKGKPFFTKNVAFFCSPVCLSPIA